MLRQNLKRHAHHYSFLGSLGPGVMTAVAERLGAGVYFNTLVPWRPHQVCLGGRSRKAMAEWLLLSPGDEDSQSLDPSALLLRSP